MLEHNRLLCLSAVNCLWLFLYLWCNSVSCVAVTALTSVSNPVCVYSSILSSYVALSNAVVPALHIGWSCHQSHCCRL